jgi:hypothetical protein
MAQCEADGKPEFLAAKRRKIHKGDPELFYRRFDPLREQYDWLRRAVANQRELKRNGRKESGKSYNR